ncbi:hypothetical protein QQ045_001279 [Rhodiola kirilowii]
MPAPSEMMLVEKGVSKVEEADERRSRNEKKRLARQAVRFGMELAALIDSQIKRILKTVDVEPELFEALALVKRLGILDPPLDVREGKRRQFNYIGKLIRDVDPELMVELIQDAKDGVSLTIEEEDGDELEEEKDGDKLEEEEEESDVEDKLMGRPVHGPTPMPTFEWEIYPNFSVFTHSRPTFHHSLTPPNFSPPSRHLSCTPGSVFHSMAQLLPLVLRPDLCLRRLIPMAPGKRKRIRFVLKESLKLLHGAGKFNGDLTSVSPVPYVFSGGIRGRRANGALEKVVERRQRRMIKNRESAARSRARKQLPEETDTGSDKERVNPAGFLTGLGITHKAFGQFLRERHKLLKDLKDEIFNRHLNLTDLSSGIGWTSWIRLQVLNECIEHHAKAWLRLKKRYQDALP